MVLGHRDPRDGGHVGVHLHAPYHFAAWRDHGLRVVFALDWHGDWMLALEVGGLPRMPGERRHALAAMAPLRDA
jgi:hypothetical protein